MALTGDGADEVFGGYNRHVLAPRLWRIAGALADGPAPPAGARPGRPGRGAARHAALHRLAARARLPVTLLDKLGRLGGLVAKADGVPGIYAHLTRGILDPTALMTPAPLGHAVTDPPLPAALDELAGTEWLMAQDSLGYLPGDILTKVDRAAMAASLETRAPFLDPRVIAAAWALPPKDRVSGGRGKVALRAMLERHLPSEIIDRPKQGFAVPLDRWLREGLRDWAESLLTRTDLLDRAGLDAQVIDRTWTSHLARRSNQGQKLWTVLMLLAWLDHDATAERPA